MCSLPGSSQDFPELELSNNGDTSHDRIEFDIPNALYHKMISSKGEKLNIDCKGITVNGNSYSVKDMHLRGSSTLSYPRKSFTVKLDTVADFSGKIEMKNFYLVSLSMDRHYYHNRVSFDMLRLLNLFPIYYRYTEVIINGESQGIYMVLERPQDWAREIANSPFILRRGRNNEIKEIKTNDEISKEEYRTYKKQYLSINLLIRDLYGVELKQNLKVVLDLDSYMTWLALNFFLRNGDYTDELNLYINPDSHAFNLIPWDYDDIFAPSPHEGWQRRNENLNPRSMIFSTEVPLDIKIGEDQVLYKDYLSAMHEMFNKIDEDRLKEVFEKTYSELSAFYANKEILAALSQDGYETSLEKLSKSMSNAYEYLVRTRLNLLNNLQND